MKIQVSEDNCFRVEADGMRKYQGYVEGGTMEIRGTSKVSSNSEGNLGGSICLYVPEDIILKIPLWIWAPEASV